MRRLLALGLVFGAGCQAPPPAPEGLDASMRYVLNEFYADDLTFGAGLTGLMNWMDAEGNALLEVDPNTKNVADFRLNTALTADDIDTMPIEHGRDPGQAPGVVGIAELDCSWTDAEAVHVRADQDVVFEGEWTTYDRTFESPRADYDAAREAGDYPAVTEALDPTAADWSSADLAPVFLKTSNALGTSNLGVDFDYTLDLHFRHGVWDVQGEPMHGMAILTWMVDSAESHNSNNWLYQVYSVDLVLEQPNDRSLRLVANYNEVGPAESDSELVQVLGIDRILDFADHLNAICGGRELPAE